MLAFCAAEETYLAFISGAELAEPPEREVVAALGALDRDCGQGLHFLLLVIDNGYLVLFSFELVRHLFMICTFNFSDIAALAAFKLPA